MYLYKIVQQYVSFYYMKSLFILTVKSLKAIAVTGPKLQAFSLIGYHNPCILTLMFVVSACTINYLFHTTAPI